MKSKKIKFAAGGLLGLAVIIAGWTYGPIVWYQSMVAPAIGNRTYVSPLPAENMVLGMSEQENYYDPGAWFVSSHQETKSVEVILPAAEEYLITIPSLKIVQANVKVNGDDLSKSLIQYHGTAAPGMAGSAVIFGHSILPQFYNPKNYKAIFSTLHTIKNGESILVEYDNVIYHYQVVDKYEVNPDDFYVLEQNLGDKTLKLITCSPPGTYLKRLVIESRLVPYDGIEELYEKAVVSGT